MPLGTEKSWVDGVIAVKDIYPRLLPLMKDAAADEIEMLSETGKIGISWGSSGGRVLRADQRQLSCGRWD